MTRRQQKMSVYHHVIRYYIRSTSYRLPVISSELSSQRGTHRVKGGASIYPWWDVTPTPRGGRHRVPIPIPYKQSLVSVDQYREDGITCCVEAMPTKNSKPQTNNKQKTTTTTTAERNNTSVVPTILLAVSSERELGEFEGKKKKKIDEYKR